MPRALSDFGSFQGRIPRSRFWLCSIALGAVFAVLFVFLEHALNRASTLALYPFFFWSAAAIAVKRLHDRGLTAWRLLLALIPIIGPLWLLVSMGIRAGTRGDNQYGADPLEAGVDYYTVPGAR